jgi:threonine dehydratase
MHWHMQNNMVYVSPYNDLHVIAGQGTVALEITRQLNNVDVILVPISLDMLKMVLS